MPFLALLWVCECVCVRSACLLPLSDRLSETDRTRQKEGQSRADLQSTPASLAVPPLLGHLGLHCAVLISTRLFFILFLSFFFSLLLHLSLSSQTFSSPCLSLPFAPPWPPLPVALPPHPPSASPEPVPTLPRLPLPPVALASP